MFSRGMLLAFASAMMVRRRGFISGSPPPLRAATDNSLMMRVKILPRLASAAPFLCLIVCHLEWPDMRKLSKKSVKSDRQLYHAGSGGAACRAGLPTAEAGGPEGPPYDRVARMIQTSARVSHAAP